MSLCEGKRVSVNVISKSGTTTESAVAFRFVREYKLPYAIFGSYRAIFLLVSVLLLPFLPFGKLPLSFLALKVRLNVRQETACKGFQFVAGDVGFQGWVFHSSASLPMD